MDAKIAYGFHHLRNEKPYLDLRNEKPYLAQGPVTNKIIYSSYSCTQGWFCTPCVSNPGLRGLRNIMKIHIKKANCSEWEEILIPKSVRSIVALNLDSYGSGRHPWGNLKPNYLEKRGFVEAHCDDGLIEIFGLKQGWHASFVMAQIITAKHIAQLILEEGRAKHLGRKKVDKVEEEQREFFLGFFFTQSIELRRTFTTSAAMASSIMTQPINLIFRFLQKKARIQIWLFEQKDLRIEGRITGFDEFMNLVLDEAEEVSIKKNTRKALGRILLKGDNITLMMNTDIEDKQPNSAFVPPYQQPECEALCRPDRIFLDGLDSDTTNTDVKEFLKRNGIQYTGIELEAETNIYGELKNHCLVILASPDQMEKALSLNGSEMNVGSSERTCPVFTCRVRKRLLVIHVTGFEERTLEGVEGVIQRTLGDLGVLSIFWPQGETFAYIVLGGVDDPDLPSSDEALFPPCPDGVLFGDTTDEDEDEDDDDGAQLDAEDEVNLVDDGAQLDAEDEDDEAMLPRFFRLREQVRENGSMKIGSLTMREANVLPQFMESEGLNLSASIEIDGRDFIE